jgi:hypothetical protein
MNENEFEFDFDAFDAEFEAQSQESTEPETEPETVEETVDEGKQEEPETQDEPEETPETPETPPSEEEKRNRAFADLRRQADENRKYAEFINRLASDAGVSPEEILQRYEQRNLEREAEERQVPVEYLQEQRKTQAELNQLKQQITGEKLDAQIQGVISEYGEDEEAISNAFRLAFQNGIDPDNIPQTFNFEQFYKAANFDKIMEQKVEKARQAELSNKAKRQSQAVIPNNGSSAPASPESDLEKLASIDAKDILANW